MKKDRYILAIDPGTHSTGWALFTIAKKYPLRWGLIKGKQKKWFDNCQQIWEQLEILSLQNNISGLILEHPEYWSGTVGASARESGATEKIMFLCGGICQIFKDTKIQLVTPSGWKGQMPKELVRKRLMKKLPIIAETLETMDHNTMDAIGIGYFIIQENNK